MHITAEMHVQGAPPHTQQPSNAFQEMEQANLTLPTPHITHPDGDVAH